MRDTFDDAVLGFCVLVLLSAAFNAEAHSKPVVNETRIVQSLAYHQISRATIAEDCGVVEVRQ